MFENVKNIHIYNDICPPPKRLQRPTAQGQWLLDMTTSDTPRVSILFHCVLFSNSCPPPKRLQHPTTQGQCHRSSGRSVDEGFCPKLDPWTIGDMR